MYPCFTYPRANFFPLSSSQYLVELFHQSCTYIETIINLQFLTIRYSNLPLLFRNHPICRATLIALQRTISRLGRETDGKKEKKEEGGDGYF